MSVFASSAGLTVDIVDAQGTKTGSVELPSAHFDVPANIPLIHQVVVAQLAAARQGTASTKTRAEVRGGGRKPHRQKGTGRARQGSTRSPQFAGGGIAHGPQPRKYAQRTPKKMIAAALRGALSDRARDGRVHVISDLVAGDSPSTRGALAALKAVSTSDKVLVVIHRDEDLAWLSLRNAVAVHAIAVDQLNAYDVLVNDEVVFTSVALNAFVAGPVSGKSAKAVATESEAFDEPSNAELAATAASVEELLEETGPEPTYTEPTYTEPTYTEPIYTEPSNAELAAPAEPVAELLETADVDPADLAEAETPDPADVDDNEEDAK